MLRSSQAILPVNHAIIKQFYRENQSTMAFIQASEACCQPLPRYAGKPSVKDFTRLFKTLLKKTPRHHLGGFLSGKICGGDN